MREPSEQRERAAAVTGKAPVINFDYKSVGISMRIPICGMKKYFWWTWFWCVLFFGYAIWRLKLLINTFYKTKTLLAFYTDRFLINKEYRELQNNQFTTYFNLKFEAIILLIRKII